MWRVLEAVGASMRVVMDEAWWLLASLLALKLSPTSLPNALSLFTFPLPPSTATYSNIVTPHGGNNCMFHKFNRVKIVCKN